MKILEWLKSKKSRNKKPELEYSLKPEMEEVEEPVVMLDRSRVDFQDEDQRKFYTVSCCEKILESARVYENAEIEYRLVTDYLVDIQQLDALDFVQRKEIEEVAEKILELGAEQQNQNKSESKMTDMQFWFYKRNEEEMPKILKKMQADEEYQRMIKSDMQHLEGEKGSLHYRRIDLLEEKNRIKNLSIVVLVSFVLLSGILFFAKEEFGLDIQTGFLVIMFAAVFSTAGLFLKQRDDARELSYVERSMKKAVSLLNKSKIRYVVTTNALEYSYDKYNVNSYYELQHLWEIYQEEKEERARMRETSEELEFFHEQLLKMLRKYYLKDPTVWIHQAAALVDSKEMVEVRHRLNVRRKKLREKMERYSKMQKEGKEEIRKLMFDYPEYAQEFKEIGGSYHIL